MKKQIIFNIAGGIGKNIAATAVVSSLKKKYPDRAIIVTTPWTIAWINNPDIAAAIDLEKTPYFYRDFILDTDSKIFRLDPYNADDFLQRRKHVAEVWCDLCQAPFKGLEPKLYFTKEEEDAVKARLFPDPNDKRPLFFIQPSGGAFNQPYPISWARDIPIGIIQEVVNEMNKRGYRTIHLRRDNQIAVEGAEWINFTLREAMCAIQFSDKRLFCDSFGAHAAAAFNLPSVVVWVTNSPKVFGYPLHENIEVKVPEEFRHRIDAYLETYNIMGIWHEHPYKDDRIFSTGEILEKLA